MYEELENQSLRIFRCYYGGHIGMDSFVITTRIPQHQPICIKLGERVKDGVPNITINLYVDLINAAGSRAAQTHSPLHESAHF